MEVAVSAPFFSCYDFSLPTAVPVAMSCSCLIGHGEVDWRANWMHPHSEEEDPYDYAFPLTLRSPASKSPTSHSPMQATINGGTLR